MGYILLGWSISDTIVWLRFTLHAAATVQRPSRRETPAPHIALGQSRAHFPNGKWSTSTPAIAIHYYIDTLSARTSAHLAVARFCDWHVWARATCCAAIISKIGNTYSDRIFSDGKRDELCESVIVCTFVCLLGVTTRVFSVCDAYYVGAPRRCQWCALLSMCWLQMGADDWQMLSRLRAERLPIVFLAYTSI